MTFHLKPPKPPKLSENDVESAICDMLRLHGWKVIRQHSGLIDLPYERKPGESAKLRIGEQGMPDWIALHPTMHKRGKPGVIWLEIKAPGGRPSRTKMVPTRGGKYRQRKGQVEYLEELRAAGFVCGWWDSLEGFREFYRKVFG